MNSFLSIYLFYFIIVYFGNFRGGKNRGSMDLVHDRGSMDLVHISVDLAHGPGPRKGPCFVSSFPIENTQSMSIIMIVVILLVLLSSWPISIYSW